MKLTPVKLRDIKKGDIFWYWESWRMDQHVSYDKMYSCDVMLSVNDYKDYPGKDLDMIVYKIEV